MLGNTIIKKDKETKKYCSQAKNHSTRSFLDPDPGRKRMQIRIHCAGSDRMYTIFYLLPVCITRHNWPDSELKWESGEITWFLHVTDFHISKYIHLDIREELTMKCCKKKIVKPYLTTSTILVINHFVLRCDLARLILEFSRNQKIT